MRHIFNKETTTVFEQAPPPEYTVTFQLRDENDQPIDGATIIVYGTVLTTDPFGETTINAPDGTYSYRILYSPKGINLTGILTVSGANKTELIEFSLINFATSDLQTASSLSNVSIDIRDGRDPFLTSAAGSTTDFYVFRNREYNYLAQKSGYIPLDRPVTITAGIQTVAIQLIQNVPYQIADVFQWQDAYQMNQPNNSKVANWQNRGQDGYGGFASNDTVSRQPTFVRNSFTTETGGKQALRFLRADRQRLSKPNRLKVSGVYELFFVGYISPGSTGPDNRQYIISNDQTPNTQWIAINNAYGELWPFWSSGNVYFPQSTFANKRLIIDRYITDGQFTVEGSAILPVQSASSINSGMQLDLDSLGFGGRETDGTANHTDFFVHEYLAFRKRLSASERTQVTDYLRAKWNL